MRLNEKEVLRYLGLRGSSPSQELLEQIQRVGRQFLTAITPHHISRRYPIAVEDGAVLLDGFRIESRHLARHLHGCGDAYLFAATLGLPADQLLRRLALTDLSAAAVGQAICTALIEDYCDEVQHQLARQEALTGRFLRSRFSPGYGDFPLAFQRELFSRLDCSKRIGVTLTDTLYMVPSKSVTAVIGVGEEEGCRGGCSSCHQTDCSYRKPAASAR